MSDSEDSTVTYTVVSSLFTDLPNIGSPGVDGPPVMLEDPYAYMVAAFQASPSPDYVSGPEYPPSPEFVPEPVYPEFMPLEDEILPAEEQPLPATVSPTADSPGYVPESDPEEYPEEDDDEDPKEDPADYTADGGDDGDEDEDAPSAEETEPSDTDESAATPPPHPAYCVTAKISIRDETPISLPPREEVERLLAMHTPPSSPLFPWSSPLPQIPFPPLPPIPSSSLPLSPPLPILAPPPASHIRPLGYRAAMIWLRAEAASTSHSLPLPPLSPIPTLTSSPPLLLPSTNHRKDRPESSSAAATRPAGGLRADYGFVATMDKEIRSDLERDVGYGITDSWDEIVEAMQGTPVVTDVAEFSQRMKKFETRVRQDTDEIYTRDRRAHARTTRLMETKAKMYREAWGRSMDVSNLARAEVMLLRTQVVAQQAVITELQAADRKRQAVITKMLAADRRRQKQFIEALKLLKRL
ncbi:hypothetical protein Tco_1093686 [Tanacetum coccineum]|uniref:Uncharacterized protein n=1 Tax=Tanacetum coccineum TaxID=301880 RepID=A0ABQ5IFQ3_9ASTR